VSNFVDLTYDSKNDERLVSYLARFNVTSRREDIETFKMESILKVNLGALHVTDNLKLEQKHTMFNNNCWGFSCVGIEVHMRNLSEAMRANTGLGSIKLQLVSYFSWWPKY